MPPLRLLFCIIALLVTLLNSLTFAYLVIKKKLREQLFTQQILTLCSTDAVVGVSVLVFLIIQETASNGLPSAVCGFTVGMYFTVQVAGLSQILGLCIQRLIIVSNATTFVSWKKKHYFYYHFAGTWIICPIMSYIIIAVYGVSTEYMETCTFNAFFDGHIQQVFLVTGTILLTSQVVTNISFGCLWRKLILLKRESLLSSNRRRIENESSELNQSALSRFRDIFSSYKCGNKLNSFRSTEKKLKDLKDIGLVFSVKVPETAKRPAVELGRREPTGASVSYKMQRRSLVTLGILLLFYNLFISPLSIGLFIRGVSPYSPPPTLRGILMVAASLNSLLNVFVYAFRIEGLRMELKKMFERLMSVLWDKSNNS